jgi:secondary thiamine-phosphate synthase enzyme
LDPGTIFLLRGETVKTSEGTIKAHTKYLWFETKERREYIRITDDVQAFLDESGLRDGFILVSAMHITAGVYINDWESGLLKDIDEWVEKLAPVNPAYNHHKTGEDNGDAHLKRILINHQVTVPVTDGKLDLGPWEQIFYAEFDGMRQKRVVLKALGI